MLVRHDCATAMGICMAAASHWLLCCLCGTACKNICETVAIFVAVATGRHNAHTPQRGRVGGAGGVRGTVSKPSSACLAVGAPRVCLGWLPRRTHLLPLGTRVSVQGGDGAGHGSTGFGGGHWEGRPGACVRAHLLIGAGARHRDTQGLSITRTCAHVTFTVRVPGNTTAAGCRVWCSVDTYTDWRPPSKSWCVPPCVCV